MSSKANKKRRQELIDAETARRYADAERLCPLARGQLNALLDFLAERIEADGHDGTFTHTREWLTRNGVSADAAVAFFKAHRMGDDWAVAVNGDPFKLFGPTRFQFSRMPIPLDALEALIRYVDGCVTQFGCDHTRRFCREWLAREGWPGPPTEFALIAQGGGCDCEVVLNVEPSNVYRRPERGGPATGTAR